MLLQALRHPAPKWSLFRVGQDRIRTPHIRTPYIHTPHTHTVYAHTTYTHTVYTHTAYAHRIYAHHIYAHRIYAHRIYAHRIYAHRLYAHRLRTLYMRTPHIRRVGKNHIYTVCILFFWQENHQIYGHIRCIYTVLANPTYTHTVYTHNVYGAHHVYAHRTPYMTVYSYARNYPCSKCNILSLKIRVRVRWPLVLLNLIVVFAACVIFPFLYSFRSSTKLFLSSFLSLWDISVPLQLSFLYRVFFLLSFSLLLSELVGYFRSSIAFVPLQNFFLSSFLS